MKKISPIYQVDSYKLFHRLQYPEGTALVYSNFTPRGSRIKNIDSIVVFGIQYFIKEYLLNQFNELFFNKPLEEVLSDYKHKITKYCNLSNIDISHIEALHKLGYLPLCIKALPEGTRCPLRIPFLTIRNTNTEFYWLTNYIETMLSNVIWQALTAATIANRYRDIVNKYADETVGNRDYVKWQCHNFSFRGVPGLESACLVDGGHLLSFTGTDTMPGTQFLEEYYGANIDTELVSGSVIANEHSTAQSGILFNSVKNNIDLKQAELNYWIYLLTKACPDGILSVVSDTFDYYRNLTEILPAIKDIILNRNGKTVVRPDSSPKTPVEIICGDPDSDIGSPEYKGSVEILWEIFGGKINDLGYKELNPKIGLIYGDSITIERCEEILEKLKQKGFAANNVVLGVGSFSYQYVTRDTFGFAIKSTYVEVDGVQLPIFKDPKTDSGLKKSAKGLLSVVKQDDGTLTLNQECDWAEERTGELRTVFKNGTLHNEQTLQEIRTRLWGNK